MNSSKAGDVVVCILAAGGGRRMGRCKQTLDWKGKPLIRHIVDIGINSGVGPVMVITGAYRKEVEDSLQEMRIATIFNDNWHKGQGASIKCALANMPTDTKACIFMMADQPFVTDGLLRDLVEALVNSDSDIYVPTYQRKRVSPVLFRATTFQTLSKLNDSQTGKDVFQNFTVQEFEVDNSRIGVDIDSEEDYFRWKDE